MRPGLAWWLKPFVGSIVAILGLFVFVVLVAAQVSVKGCDFHLYLEGPPLFPFPADQAPDLDIAPGEPGYVASLGLVGRQLHYEDSGGHKTWIAIEAWFLAEPWRIAVAEYDGPPTPLLRPETVRPLKPLLPMLVVRTGGAPEVWWAGGAMDGSEGPTPAEKGELNLLVLPGKLALWTHDSPHYEIEVEGGETVWCSLGPEGLGIDRREKR